MKVRVWVIGLFLVLGFSFAVAILFLIGSQQKLFGQHMEVYAEFTNLSGIDKGSKVQVSGLDAGEVNEVIIPKSPAGKFRLRLQLEKKATGLVRSDSLVTIETAGVVGDKFISIKKGSESSPEVKSGATLPSKEPFNIAQITDKAAVILEDFQGTLDEVRGRLDSTLGTVQTAVTHVDQTVLAVSPRLTHVSANIDRMVTDLNAGKGSIGLLLRDDATREQLRSTLANVHQASADAQQAVAGVNATVSDFQSRHLVANLQHSLDNIQSLTSQLQVAVNDALSADSMGQSGAQNIQATLSNLNRGTANLADDTEALKHNFFLRGFFKKRGFYSLDELTGTEYVAALERNKVTGPRIWIQASVFETSHDGDHEQISDSGRIQIDSLVASSVASFPGAVIVIEGYSHKSPPDTQFIVAQRRADLVRHYLQLQFHLRSSDIGTVVLTDPPKSSDRTTWDGAAIMVIGKSGKP